MAKRPETNVGKWLEAILTGRGEVAQALLPGLKADREGTLAQYEVLRIASQRLVRQRFVDDPDEVEIVEMIAGIMAVSEGKIEDPDRLEEILRSDLGLTPPFIDEYSGSNWRCRSVLAVWSSGAIQLSDDGASRLVVEAEKLARQAGARPSLAEPSRASRLFRGWTR